MIRLIIVVEGQTEEAFVKEVLKPHLDDREVYTSATIVGKMIAQKRGHQGAEAATFETGRRTSNGSSAATVAKNFV